jgi:hypothetical protein
MVAKCMSAREYSPLTCCHGWFVHRRRRCAGLDAWDEVPCKVMKLPRLLRTLEVQQQRVTSRVRAWLLNKFDLRIDFEILP